MGGYSKLFESILDSSVWFESDAVVRVWVTLLAMKDRDGIVHASLPGLAHRAHKSVEETRAALEIFMSPDEHSRTPDNEGKRINEVAGGWQVLNHEIYQERDSLEERRKQDRERQRRRREKMRDSHVTGRDMSRDVTVASSSSVCVSDESSDQEGGSGGKPKAWDDPDWPGHVLVTLWLDNHPHWGQGHDDEALAHVRQDVDRILRLDKRPAPLVREVFEHIMDDQPRGDWPGWAANMLWPGKLRLVSKSQAPLKNWDVLVKRLGSRRQPAKRPWELPEPNSRSFEEYNRDDDDEGPGNVPRR
jgi:hypothetical protein